MGGTGFKIPKNRIVGPWSIANLENFKKNFPHLRNFDDEICGTLR
jgi:hypothetical protein